MWKRLITKSTLLTCTGGVLLTTASSMLVHEAPDVKIKSQAMQATAGAAIRFLRSVGIGMTISIDYWLAGFYLNPESSDYTHCMSELHTRNAHRILNGCLLNGGTYIKIGQGLVSLSHILPKEYITALADLQDRCLMRQRGEVDAIFLQEFGKPPAEIFEWFDTEPIAAASLAQVFVATTKKGEHVAVKVQYQDLQERFSGDVSTIDMLLKFAGYLHPDYDFGWILDDISENLRSELDFQNEGRNSEQCACDLQHLNFIYVPKVHWDLCSKRVLVTEFINGIKINEKEALIKAGHKLADIDRKMFLAFGEQIFQVGFVHADPHPGNVFVRKYKNQTQLVLLDHGLYQSLSEDERVGLSHFWRALVVRDIKKMQKYSNELGVTNYSELAEVLTQTPLRKKFQLVTHLTQEELDYFAEVAANRFDIITKTLKDMPRSLLFVVRNLNTLRSIAHDHGDPVNRYTILARVATRTAFKASDSFWKKIGSIPLRLSFEYQLLMQKWWLSFMSAYFGLLKRLGRSPDASSLLAIMS